MDQVRPTRTLRAALDAIEHPCSVATSSSSSIASRRPIFGEVLPTLPGAPGGTGVDESGQDRGTKRKREDDVDSPIVGLLCHQPAPKRAHVMLQMEHATEIASGLLPMAKLMQRHCYLSSSTGGLMCIEPYRSLARAMVEACRQIQDGSRQMPWLTEYGASASNASDTGAEAVAEKAE